MFHFTIPSGVGFKITQNNIIKLKNKNITDLVTTYGTVPIQKGMLINLELDSQYYLKTKKLRFYRNKEILAYPIDAPAVKAALWKPNKDVSEKIIDDLLSWFYKNNFD